MIKRPTDKHIQIINDFKADLKNEEYIKYYEVAYLGFVKKYDDEWADYQRVVEDAGGNLLGFLFCHINRTHDRIDNIELMNITKTINITFTKDIVKILEELRDRYRKITFEVVIGNPAEKIYNKIIKKCNGRTIGTAKNHVKLMDGKYYDMKFYEINKEIK